MSGTQTSSRTFRVREGNYADALAFVESLLSRKDINDELAKETQLIFEALMQSLVNWGLDENTELEIAGKRKLGGLRIEIGFEGDFYAYDQNTSDSPERRVLESHDDKLEFEYQAGYNTINISVSKSQRAPLGACTIAFIAAIVCYLIIGTQFETGEQRDLLTNYIFPLEKMYTNIMLMVGAPMTFFSLLKNLSDTYIISRRNTGMRQLHIRTIGTSVFAIVLAFVAFLFLSLFLSGLEGAASAFAGSIKRSFADVVVSFAPPSIFEPFEVISPIPLMVLAILCTLALCSSGKYFSMLQQAMMACYTLFSRILNIVIAVMPAFFFLALLDVLLDSGFEGLIGVLIYVVCVLVGILLLFVTYAIRLRAHGVAVIPFVKKIIPLVRENYDIGSSIDATPYNIRYCSKVLNMGRSMLERNIPVLAEINLDGNCFILMSFALMFLFSTGMEVSWLNLIGLAAMILFLSVGSPNQPGSILIGTLIITMYLNSPDVLCIALYSEGFLGGMQNIVNVIGDVVMVAIDDSKEKALDAAS